MRSLVARSFAAGLGGAGGLDELMRQMYGNSGVPSGFFGGAPGAPAPASADGLFGQFFGGRPGAPAAAGSSSRNGDAPRDVFSQFLNSE